MSEWPRHYILLDRTPIAVDMAEAVTAARVADAKIRSIADEAGIK
jgi:hypothetical protein